MIPAHVDPTMAMHEVAWLVDGDDVVGALARRPPRLGMTRARQAPLAWAAVAGMAVTARRPMDEARPAAR